MKQFKLHNDIKLGVATAATQIEGGDKNNTWYKFSSEPGNVKDGSSSLVANNHYILYKEDIALMKSMNIEIYRMSLEWSRIEPQKGIFNEEAINHYIDEITLLKKAGIEVLVTLHHFSNPLWFDEMEAFEKRENITYFLEYVKYVVTKLNGLVKEYCTINEANIYAVSCYLFGDWAPKKKSLKATKNVMRNLSISHIESYKIIKGINPNTKVGFANHIIKWAPKHKHSIIDKIGARFMEKCFQTAANDAMAYGKFRYPIGHVRKYKGEFFDYFGMNFYTKNTVRGFKQVTVANQPHNDLGWVISAESLREMCEKYHNKYKKNIYITENGTCDSNDDFRARYIYDHLLQISDLSYIKRYYHWTFIDNFEWAQGESARFGLVALNFRTQERTIRSSGEFYSKIIKTKEVTQKDIAKYVKNYTK